MGVVLFRPIIREIAGEELDLAPLTVTFDESAVQKFEVADSTSDSDIFPAQLTAVDWMCITSDQAISYEHNGADTTITLDANGVHLLAGTNITALTVTNSSGSTANVKLWCWGT